MISIERGRSLLHDTYLAQELSRAVGLSEGEIGSHRQVSPGVLRAGNDLPGVEGVGGRGVEGEGHGEKRKETEKKGVGEMEGVKGKEGGAASSSRTFRAQPCARPYLPFFGS